MTFGRTISRAAEFYADLLGRFLIALVLLLSGLNLIAALVSHSVGSSALRWLLLFLATVLGSAWGQAAMVEDIRDRHDGKGDASILDLFARTWRAAPQVAWATLCAGFLVGLVLGGTSASSS